MSAERNKCCICQQEIRNYSSKMSDNGMEFHYYGGNGKRRWYCMGCVHKALYNLEQSDGKGNAPQGDKCAKCGEVRTIWLDVVCVDCWPGYDTCATADCDHYRSEHAGSCGNFGCKCKRFVEKQPNPRR